MSSLNYEYPLARDPRFLTGGFHPSFGDPTWKERHAKGVPVKMTTNQFIDYHVDSIIGHRPKLTRNGDILIEVSYPGQGSATFCNFRYKQSWLDRKEIAVVPSCRFAGPCTFPECGADPEEGPYACEARPQKGGKNG